MSLDLASLTFLLVEDSAYMRTILRTMLQGFGARRIVEAEDGASGLEAMERANPDILILDWVMPILDGADMVRMIRNGSGIVCLCLDQASADALELEPMVRDNQARHGTGFTVSIEAAEGVTTGVSAIDRVRTITAALESIDGPRRIVSPGHVFPLRARAGGVLERRGHTEGSLDLAILAGLRPASVLCELMNDDGTMAGNDDIQRYAEAHGLPILTIEEIAAYRAARTARCA